MGTSRLIAVMDSRTFGIRVALALGFLVTLAAAQTAQPTDQPSVSVLQGQLFGTAEPFQESQFINVDKTVNVFRGIPFAEPPVGERRFRPPVAKEPWGEPYNATYFRPACIQDPSFLFGLTMDEDCLYLNIFAPSSPVPGGAAVMVWIHGGGFSVGSGASANYNGNPLVALGDVIVVTINYRLNLFGFLTTGDDALPGNLGLMDQLMALQWIKENIAAFGGNSDQITIFGESAGSASVNFHLLSQLAEGLFNQAIMQSGTAFSPWGFSDDRDFLRQQAYKLGEHFRCSAPDSYALMNCLRDQSALDLFNRSNPLTFRSAVVVDGTFLTDTQHNLYSARKFNHAKILQGSNKDESTFIILTNPLFADNFASPNPPFVSREAFDQILLESLSLYNTDQLADAIRMQYIDWSVADYSNTDYFRTFVDSMTDFNFACGHDLVARAHSHAGDDVYLYQMTHAPSVSLYNWGTGGVGPGWLGASHAEDLTFMFGVPFMPWFKATEPSLTDEEMELSVKFMEFWTNFAKTGSPGLKTPGSQPESDGDYWPRFTVPELEYKVLSLNLTTGRALKADDCHFWNTYVVQLRTMLGELEVAEREWRQSFYSWKYNDLADWRDEFAKYKAVTMN